MKFQLSRPWGAPTRAWGFPAALAALSVFALQGCGLGSSSSGFSLPGVATRICLDTAIADETARQKAAQDATLIALFDAHEGDTIEFCEGLYNFTSGLTLSGKRGITIKGAGIGKTYLRFKDSTDQDGFNINRMTGITIQDLTIYDAPGNGLRIFRSDYVNVRGVKVGWSVSDPGNAVSPNPYGNYAPPDATGKPPSSWTANGSYAFYPVLAHHVLIEDSISVGSSDAGVYVGQSSDILVRRTEAYHNVAGFEFENTYRAEFVDNIAHDNVGGFLVFDLPGRGQYGEKNLVHDNRSYDNNVASFAPRGAIVGDVPSGTGMLVLASDQLEVYRNTVTHNKTVGLAIVNYGLVSTKEGDRKYDFFPEGLHIYDNKFEDNAGNPQPPDNSRNSCNGNPNAPAGVPSTSDLNQPDCNSNNASLLVTIIQAKNNGNSAQIVWDGARDQPDTHCVDAPTDHEGVTLTQAHPGETGRYEARFDERGRPNYYIFDNPPKCSADSVHHTYNRWKFSGDSTTPKLPENGMCLEGNTFTKSAANPADDFVNVHFATADPTAPENQTPGDHNQPHDCPSVAAPLLAQYLPRLGSFSADPANDPRPSLDQLAAVCNSGSAGKLNTEALAKYNCPRLDQYGLFQNPADPTANPSGSGVLFGLNTALFSDYAVKDRFLFLPDGQKATYVDANNCHDHGVIQIFGCNTATLDFPVGTVFAKTFAFRKNGVDNVVETRLLIKRQNAAGLINWIGMAYLWNDHCAATGTRCAELKIEGARQDVSYDYDDPDPAVGTHYSSGSQPVHYVIPNAGNCLLCHGGDDREAGAAPIGPKVRNLNKDHDYGGSTGVKNQLAHWSDLGLLDLPATIEAPMPKWNVIGSGSASDAREDKHRRVRSFLEVNCMHCHNPGGAAQNSGLSLDGVDALDLDANTKMNEGHGICKPPIAAGKAADKAFYDIVPTDSGNSLLFQRVSSTEPGIKMPPLARSVTQMEAVNLIGDWINTVVDTYAESDTCKPASGGTPPAPGAVPLTMTAPN